MKHFNFAFPQQNAQVSLIAGRDVTEVIIIDDDCKQILICCLQILLPAV